MNRRDLIRGAVKSALGLALYSALPARGAFFLKGGASLAAFVPPINPVGTNIAAGGSATFNFEDLPLTQDLVPMGREFDTATAGTINSGVFASTNSSGFPTEDFGQYLHITSQSPSWMSGGFACGYVSNGSGTETITGVGATVSNVNRSAAPTVTFTLTPTAGTWGYTITGTTGGVASVWAYLPAYAANASNGHVPITASNVRAGKPVFTNEVKAIYGKLRYFRSLWAQNMWSCMGGIQVAFASNPAATATSGTLVANNLAPGTYTCFFTPTSTPPIPPTTSTCADVRSITISSTGQTAISWTGGLNYGASAITLACSSATRNTANNTPTQGAWHGSAYSIEGYSADWFTALSAACAPAGPWLCLPVNDDGTYFPAVMAQAKGDVPENAPIYFELSDELWNGTGEAAYCFDALALAAFPADSGNYNAWAAAYLATRLHAIANQGRTTFGSDWNTRVRLVCAWQQATAGFLAKVCAYMVSQGWSPSADLWCVSEAPYLNAYPALATSDSVATIESKLTTGATFPLAKNGTTQNNQGLEACIAVGLWYQLPGVFECYEAGWDSKALGSSYTNIGAAIVDNGMTAVMETYWNTLLDCGVNGFQNFEGGVSSSAASNTPLDEWDSNYSNVVAETSPRLVAMLNFTSGAYTASRNVVNSSGVTIDCRNYLDCNTTTAAGYPTFTAQSNISPVNNYNVGWMFQCPAAQTRTIEIYLTTTASGSFNVYLDGTEVASGVSFANGLNGTSSAPVTLVTSQALSQGHHYLEIGNGSAIIGLTANELEFV